MLKFYKKMSPGVKICYAVSFASFLIIFIISMAVFYGALPEAANTINQILTAVSVLAAAAVSFIVCKFMSNTVISSEKNIRAVNIVWVNLKHIAAFVVLMLFLAIAISEGGGFVVSIAADTFTDLRMYDFPMYCIIVKIPLAIIFLAVLAFVARHTGLGDAATRAFNPHMMLIVLICAITIMMPSTVYNHMYENSDGRGNTVYTGGGYKGAASSMGKTSYNVQTVFSNNIDLYRDNYNSVVNEKFSIGRVFLSVLAMTGLQIFMVMIAYNIGGKAYYVRHPNMSEDELYSHL